MTTSCSPSARTPNGTYGSEPEGLLDVDGDIVTFADGAPFGTEISPDELMQDIRDLVATPATQPDLVADRDTGPPPELRAECEVRLELALERPILVARGVDPIPSGFDAVNEAGCGFRVDVRAVTLELQLGGDIVFAQEIVLDPVPDTVEFPL